MSNDWSEKTRPGKEKYRNMATCKKNKKPYRHIILLPGEGHRCYNELWENGCIDQNTMIHAVDGSREGLARRMKILDAFERRMEADGIKNYAVYPNRLSELSEKKWFATDKYGKIDYAFLDTCCQPSTQILAWLSEMCQKNVFSKNCIFAVTFSALNRRQEFFHAMRQMTLFNKNPDFILQPFLSSAKICSVRATMNKHVRNSFDLYFQRCDTDVAEKLVFLTMMYGFTGYKMKFVRSHIYKSHSEGQNMIYMEFRAIGSLSDGDTTTQISRIEDIVNRYNQSVGPISRVNYKSSQVDQPTVVVEKTKTSGYKKTTPPGMTPQKWAWSWDNPDGIRYKKSA